ncbi:hypothetical protein [Aquiflexum sp.]|uniref:hypothetical protein n=1 Tax=Aquiflexum sp. TaxID=1872584 RepID=UPI0035936F58
MDRLVTKYEKLFSIRFTHPEYTFSGAMGGILSDKLSVLPDLPTQKLFKRHDIQYRMRQDTLLVFLRIRVDSDIPYFRLPNIFTARFHFSIQDEVLAQTEIPETHGGETMYRFRINLRSSQNSMNLSSATLGQIESREPEKVFHHVYPPFWETVPVNLKGTFGVIDIVTEGSSTHRLYTDVTNQNLFYTPANGNEHEHLFTVHLNT